MNDNEEFAHMRGVFMPIDSDRPDLPFSEFITDFGLHRVAKSGEFANHFFAQYSIPRNGGTIGVSIVSGSMFDCTPDAPYEVMVNGEGYARTHITDEQLMILLAKLISGESLYD